MNKATQIPFDLGARHAFGRDDFQIGSSNKDAIGWLDKWPKWPAPVLVLHGPASSGKSHLAAVWRDISGAHIIDPKLLISKSADELSSRGDALLIDGLDLWLGDMRAETTLFHLYNILKETEKSMLITSRMALNHADFMIADLASRFRAAPSVGIAPPDDMLLASVLIKLFSDRQLNVSNDILSYILPRMERSFAAAHEIVGRADHKALSERKAISIPLMRAILVEMHDDL